MSRFVITYRWRNKLRKFSTVASCEQLAIKQYSKEKALIDAEFIKCEMIK
nr:hypothetical protein 8 [Halomonadaceae bacterium]